MEFFIGYLFITIFGMLLTLIMWLVEKEACGDTETYRTVARIFLVMPLWPIVGPFFLIYLIYQAIKLIPKIVRDALTRRNNVGV